MMAANAPETRTRSGIQNPFGLLKSYLFWTYQRGSFHYDVMVTAILLFLFVTPHLIDYKDRPVETVALHSSEVLVKEAGMSGYQSRFLYQIRADEMGSAHTDAQLQAALLRVIEPISGEVTLERYEPVKDAGGHVIAYNAWVLR
jgi:hypothetical protein